MSSPISIGQAGLNDRPHALYRFFDASDVLLYVGITVDLGARFKKHGGDKPWWGNVDRIGIDHFATRKEALDAERKAIKEERPLHNVVHNEFVQPESTNRDELTAEFAGQLLDSILGIPVGSARYNAILHELKGEFFEGKLLASDELEVLLKVLADQEYELHSLNQAMGQVLGAIPRTTVEQYRRAELKTWSEELGDVCGPNPPHLDHGVLERIAADLAWQGLSAAPAEERIRFVELARSRCNEHASASVIHLWAFRYYQHHLDGNLQQVLESEGSV